MLPGTPAPGVHPSFGRYLLPREPGDGGPCLIEPAVRCNHCGFCQSHGVLSRPPFPCRNPRSSSRGCCPRALDLLREHCAVDLYDKHDPMPRELLMDKVAKVDAVIAC